MKKHKMQGPLQVLFICPHCGKRLAWALPSAGISCPRCENWVTDANRLKDGEVFLQMDSDQIVLFADEEEDK